METPVENGGKSEEIQKSRIDTPAREARREKIQDPNGEMCDFGVLIEGTGGKKEEKCGAENGGKVSGGKRWENDGFPSGGKRWKSGGKRWKHRWKTWVRVEENGGFRRFSGKCPCGGNFRC